MENKITPRVICHGQFDNGKFTPDNPAEMTGQIKKGDVVRFCTDDHQDVEPTYIGGAWLCKEIIN